MCEHNSQFSKFILESVSKYLQTVVVVDDRIYEKTSSGLPTGLMAPPTRSRKAAVKSAQTENDKKSALAGNFVNSEKSEEVSFHDVQNSFAKKRIVCSLYQPLKTASFGEQSDVYCLCSTADVVIVDWDLHGDMGNKATILVGSLIEQSMKEIPHQLRLVLIYTMEANLQAIASKIYDDLVTRIKKELIDVDKKNNGLVLTTKTARIVVLGKRENTALKEYADYWVPEKKLAERTIFEFSHLASGLLQAIVLRGVANLRANNRRILTRFHEGLDTAFLVHRALILPEETFSQIIPLLTDELRAVLEDTFGENLVGTNLITEGIIADWCAMRWKPISDAQESFGKKSDVNEFAKNVFSNGPIVKESYTNHNLGKFSSLVDTKTGSDGIQQWGSEKKCYELAKFLTAGCGGDLSHLQFSSLMSQRIAYRDSRRTLHLGVIVKELSQQGRYLLCLQPVCDSVRLKGKLVPFIFCCLEIHSSDHPVTHVVINLKNEIVQLHYKPKTTNCFVTSFTTNKDSVHAISNDNDDQITFEDNKKIKYEWIAELKTEHAQRAAEEFGSALSRVGLSESEWLRLKAKLKK